MEAAVSFFALIIVAVLGLVFMGGLVLAVSLLAHRKTRPVGFALLGVGVIVVLAGFLVTAPLLYLRSEGSAEMVRRYHAHSEAKVHAGLAARRMSVEESPVGETSDEVGGETSGRTARASGSPSGASKPASGVLPAVGQSLARGASVATAADSAPTTGRATRILAATSKALAKALEEQSRRSRRGPSGSRPAKPPKEETPENKPESLAGPVDVPVSLRDEFERWVEARTEATMSELRTEFDAWLETTGRRPAGGLAPLRGAPAWVTAEDLGLIDRAEELDRIDGDRDLGLIVGDYCARVSVGPYATGAECDEALGPALQQAVADYAERYFGPGGSAGLHLPPGLLRDELVVATWDETQVTDFGPEMGPRPMIHRYALLRFDQPVKEDLRRMHHRAVVDRRLWKVGFGLAGVLGTLGVALGLLKIGVARRRTASERDETS